MVRLSEYVQFLNVGLVIVKSLLTSVVWCYFLIGTSTCLPAVPYLRLNGFDSFLGLRGISVENQTRHFSK